MEQNRISKTKSRRNYLATGARVAGLAFAAALLATSLIATSGSTSQAQTQSVAAKPQQVKLGVKQRGKKTDLKLVVERGALTKVTATDSAGTRSLKRIDKLAIPCADEAKECKTVELEGGVLVGVCYCKDTQTALLLPAVQKVREAAISNRSSNSTSGHVKVFSGNTGAEISSGAPSSQPSASPAPSPPPRSSTANYTYTGLEFAAAGQKGGCWTDEKLKLTICPQ